jgi:hypothetical protein
VDPRVFPLTAAQLHEYWPKLKPELERLYRIAPAEWIPEDIYADVRSGVSFVYVVEVEGTECGFFVLRPQSAGELLLHIVDMFRDAPAYLRRRTMLEGVCAIRQLAIQHKYTKVTALSQRRGATRLFERYGFHPVEVKFEMKI